MTTAIARMPAEQEGDSVPWQLLLTGQCSYCGGMSRRFFQRYVKEVVRNETKEECTNSECPKPYTEGFY